MGDQNNPFFYRAMKNHHSKSKIMSISRGERGGAMLWYASLSASIDGSRRFYGSGLPPRSDDSQ